MRLRGERGQASVEFVGTVGWLLLAALMAWQLLLAGWAVTSASNAARTGSRVQGRGGDGHGAAISSLSSPLREHAQAEVDGERTLVRVRVPLLIPGLSVDSITVAKSATLPDT